MMYLTSCLSWIWALVIFLSSLGVILAKKPVHACLSFLLTLLTLASLYLQLNAPFLAVMQVLVYAGAILVIFMFVIVLFQDAHTKVEEVKSNRTSYFLALGASAFILALTLVGSHLKSLSLLPAQTKSLGSAGALGKVLYTDFFFPFEAVSVLFLIAVVGALYIGKKES